MELKMKLKKILYYLAIIILLDTHLWAQNTNPVVANVAFSISGTTVTVTYNVADAEQDEFTIIMLVSNNNGSTWDYNYGTATGDIGTEITEGTNKTIYWEYTGGYNPNFKIRIYANDETADGSPCIASFNYEGKTYTTIQIGTQCWLKENLDMGTRIDGSLNQTNNSPTNIIEKYCYGDDPNNCTTYGGLYQWGEAMQYATTEGARGICPEGWHIPTFAEFQTLSTTVGDDGNTLKAIGQGTVPGAGTNTSGFSAFLAGNRYYAGGFTNLGLSAAFWSSTGFDVWGAYYMFLDSENSGVNVFAGYKEWGYNVRCVKD